MRNYPKPKYNAAEQELKRTIARWLQLKGAYVLYYPSFRGTMRGGKMVMYHSPFMPPGVPDILACWKGRFVGIEVKRPRATQMHLKVIGAARQDKGRVSENQLREIAAIRRALGTALVAYSLQDVIDALDPSPKAEPQPIEGTL